MLARIAYCAAFISRAVRAEWADEASGRPRAVPRRRVVFALAAASAVTSMAKAWLGRPQSTNAAHAAHVALGAVCLVAVGVVVMREEPELLVALRAARHRGGRAAAAHRE